MKNHLRTPLRKLKDNRSGFTFVELLVVIVIMAVLVASSANYLFSQGGSKARDIERKNDIKQVAALVEQFSASYGAPPNAELKNRKVERYTTDCKADDYQTLMKCFKELKYADGEGIINLAEDPKQAIENDGGKVYQYLYGANNNGWKLCALLENQTDPDLNDNYEGSGLFGDENERAYCVVASNRKLDYIKSVDAGSFDFDALSN